MDDRLYDNQKRLIGILEENKGVKGNLLWAFGCVQRILMKRHEPF